MVRRASRAVSGRPAPRGAPGPDRRAPRNAGKGLAGLYLHWVGGDGREQQFDRVLLFLRKSVAVPFRDSSFDIRNRTAVSDTPGD